MKKARTLGLGLSVVLSIGCSQPQSNQNLSSTADLQSSTRQVSPSPRGNSTAHDFGWMPKEACGYLSHISGLQTGSYKNEYEDVYGCLSPYKDLGKGFPVANNIAYYVEGDAQKAIELKLVLNVYDRGRAQEAHTALLKYSDELTKKALGVSLPKDATNAITSGQARQWLGAELQVEVKRDDWPTGRGYEVHYIIRRRA